MLWIKLCGCISTDALDLDAERQRDRYLQALVSRTPNRWWSRPHRPSLIVSRLLAGDGA